MAERPAGMPAAADPGPAKDPAPSVTLEKIRYARGGKPLIDGLSADFAPRGVTAIMGPNGAGKSLTLRLIAGLIAPDSGRLARVAGPPPLTALVSQTPVLLRRSVAANLDHALRLCGAPRAGRRARAAELLARGKLSDLAGRPARMLSGGEKQRLSLLRALAAAPRLLLLDEVTASLDPHSTAAMETLIKNAVAGGAKAVLVTHDAGQARRLADEILFLHHGRAAELTPAVRFFAPSAGPASPEARAYLAGRLLL